MEHTTDLDYLKFPIGPFVKKDVSGQDELNLLIADIEAAALAYKGLGESLKTDDLLKTYREGSWNVQQLIHHVADIQLLHFLRMKRALTEPDYKDVTLINMNGWVETNDGSHAPIADSILMLEGIAKRYVYLISSLTEEQLRLAYYHPVREFYIDQAQAVAMSAWHMKHHLAHIHLALEQGSI